MLGAILGDMVGSPYEFDRNNHKSKDFPLLSERSHFTDDTVMTLAVARGLMAGPGRCTENLCRSAVRNAAFGQCVSRCRLRRDVPPVAVCGASAALRQLWQWLCHAGGGGRLAVLTRLDKTLEMAKVTAEVTHNHPEGIKGAQATAAAIFLARTGHSKPEIRQYVEQTFGYDLSRTCDEIRPGYRHVETCQQTVPEAIIAFLESNSFEDALRNAVSLGGDSDTLACITGGIAEAFYGMPQELRAATLKRLPEDLRAAYELFRQNLERRM